MTFVERSPAQLGGFSGAESKPACLRVCDFRPNFSPASATHPNRTWRLNGHLASFEKVDYSSTAFPSSSRSRPDFAKPRSDHIVGSANRRVASASDQLRVESICTLEAAAAGLGQPRPDSDLSVARRSFPGPASEPRAWEARISLGHNHQLPHFRPVVDVHLASHFAESSGNQTTKTGCQTTARTGHFESHAIGSSGPDRHVCLCLRSNDSANGSRIGRVSVSNASPSPTTLRPRPSGRTRARVELVDRRASSAAGGRLDLPRCSSLASVGSPPSPSRPDGAGARSPSPAARREMDAASADQLGPGSRPGEPASRPTEDRLDGGQAKADWALGLNGLSWHEADDARQAGLADVAATSLGRSAESLAGLGVHAWIGASAAPSVRQVSTDAKIEIRKGDWHPNMARLSIPFSPLLGVVRKYLQTL
ncbi:unnamed protein product [Protopolystoma xenopodis]|uniref:Uncharacterized protein n=1 Tax=Protopolystoma xenopodis TaxID=117903 RepID=A0A448WMM1_9PLAT|nr:unnamed protein product [Protopolystoma xenopodis]